MRIGPRTLSTDQDLQALATTPALRPLEPAPPLGLARDFVLKMRRRKGLADTVAVASYLERDMAVALAQAGMDIA